jgi:sec-independent protein translocase protein TatB
MFDFSWSHMVVIAIVALVVIGPKELPTVLRTVGQWMGKVRRMAAEFHGQFQEALREAEMADLKQHFDDISTAARDIPRFDPIATVRREIEGATSFSSVPTTPAGSGSDAAPAGAAAEPATTAGVDAPAPAPAVPTPDSPVPAGVEGEAGTVTETGAGRPK